MDGAWRCPLKFLREVRSARGQEGIQAILLGLGWCLARESKSAAKHQEDTCTATVQDLADRGVCGNTCELCSFYLLILPLALLIEQLDPTSDSNQTVLLGRGKCPRLLWALCDKGNS